MSADSAPPWRVARTRTAPVPGRLVVAALCGAVLAFATAPATAAPSDSGLAETLYQAARTLMADGKYAEACPKFAESYRVSPATGTLLNLAACHEAQGKLASAWAEFMDGAVAAQRDGRPDRVQYAEEHSKAIFPRLSRLTIVAAPGVDTSELEITLDGVIVGSATLGVAAPLDPGEHVIQAKAPSKRSFIQKITLGQDADEQTVTVVALVPEAPTPAVVPPPSVAPQAAATTEPQRAVAPERPAPIPASVWIAGGATIALGVATVVTGAMYLDRRSSYQDHRATTDDPNDEGPDHDAAQTLGVVNAVVFAGALVGAGLTTYFYITRPKAPVVTGKLTAKAAPGFASLVVSGEF